MAAFIIGRPRMDAVAACAFIILVISGIVEPYEALAAFSDSSIIIIALMFVISAGLAKTGVSSAVGDWILKRSKKSETSLVITLMVSVAIMGSVMSTTGVVAIFIPVTLSICSRRGMPPSRLMMPLAFAGITSAPNLIANGALIKEGYDGFGFFDVTPIGISVLAAGIIYMLLTRKFLRGANDSRKGEPRLKFSDFIRAYALDSQQKIFEVPPDSPIVGMEISELKLRENWATSILCIERRSRLEKSLVAPTADTRILAGDILLCNAYGQSRDFAGAEGMMLNPLPISGEYFSEHSAEMSGNGNGGNHHSSGVVFNRENFERSKVRKHTRTQRDWP